MKTETFSSTGVDKALFTVKLSYKYLLCCKLFNNTGENNQNINYATSAYN